MPPRIEELFCCLRLQNTPVVRTIITRSFTSTPTRSASTVAQRRKHQDPYALAQARARRAANLSRQEVLRVERSKAFGDPVRGISTPFLESFDTAKPTEDIAPKKISTGTGATDIPRHLQPYSKSGFLNHFITTDELAASIQNSEHLTQPIASFDRGSLDPAKEAATLLRHREGHANAAEALARIASLENSSSKDRTRVYKQRCIETFGRHNTDTFLRPKAPSTADISRPWMEYVYGKEMKTKQTKEVGDVAVASTPSDLSDSSPASTDVETLPVSTADDYNLSTSISTSSLKSESINPSTSNIPATPRAGPDTGSSEVQIAILTTKIRALSLFLDSPRGRKDKVNKRNLRLLVHRRQKLLVYLRRKERGGDRWRRCVEMLGLGEGTWRGEITL